jgi:WD40 repeat protein
MSISRAYAAAVVCALLAALCAGCGGGAAASSGAHASTQQLAGTKSGPCGGDRPIVYLEGAVGADGTPVGEDATKGIGNAWSPDGSTDAYVAPNGRKIMLSSASDGPQRTLFAVPRKIGIVDRLAWSPDGSRLALILLDERGFSGLSVGGGALGAYRPHLLVIDVTSGHPLRDTLLTPAIVNMPFITNPPDALAFSPDGSKVLVSWDSPAVVDVASGRVQRLWRSPAVAAWSPSGDVLFLDVIGRHRFGALHVWSPGGARVLWPQAKLVSLGITAEHGIEYGQLRPSPDGTKLAIRTTDGSRTAISVFALDGSSVGAKAGTYPVDGRIWDFDWSPDGSRIAAVVLNGSALNVQLLAPASGLWKPIADVPINVPDSDTMEALAPVKKLTWSN